MKRALFLLAFLSMAAVGCQTHIQTASKGCQKCGPIGQGQYAGCRVQNTADYVPKIPHNYAQQVQPAGPPTGTVAYPYYTSRGPRDFFQDGPSTIGY